MQQSAADYKRLHHLPPSPPDFFSQYFPMGLKVLLVGTDNVTQNSIQRHLPPPRYHITYCHSGTSALQHLQNKDVSFDLILSDVFLEDMDGYQFISHQRAKTNIPHVAISGLERASSIRTAYKSGVCYVLWKPVNDSELRNLWQHVCKRREQDDHQPEIDFFNGDADDNNHNYQQNRLLIRQQHPHQDEGCSSSLVVSRDNSPKVENGSEFVNNSNHGDQSALKKRRIVWTQELHQNFLNAVNILGGVEKAVPKAVLDKMVDVPFLSRENVASHLQKYRMYLKRMEEDWLSENHNHMNAMPVNQMPPCNGPDYGRLIANNNISAQPVTTVRFQPDDVWVFQNPSNNHHHHPHLLEPSRNNPPPPPSHHLTDEGTSLWSLAHQGHHSNQPHHHYHHQRQMQPPQQNFSFGHPHVVPIAMVPPAPYAGNVSNMQQQQIAQNLITSGMQQLDQNLSSGSCHGNNMKQTNQNLASSSCHGGIMEHFDQNLASGSCHGGNMEHFDHNLGSGTSYGSNMQITQNLNFAMQHQGSSQNLASSSCHGNNMNQLDQNLASGSCHGGNMKHFDQNLASGTSHGSNMQMNQNLTSAMQHQGSNQNLASSSCHGNSMNQLDQNLASGSCHGGNMEHFDQNLSSGTSYGSNMQMNQNLTSAMQHQGSSQNLASSSCHGNNMNQLDQNLASGSCHGGNMKHFDQNLPSSTSYGSNMQMTQNLTFAMQHQWSSQNPASSSCHGNNMNQLDQNLASGSCHGGNMEHFDQNLVSGASYGSNMQMNQNLTSAMQHQGSSQNLASSSCHGNNMNQLDQNLASGSCHGGNMEHFDQNLASGTSYGSNTQMTQNLTSAMQHQGSSQNLASGSCHGGNLHITQNPTSGVQNLDVASGSLHEGNMQHQQDQNLASGSCYVTTTRGGNGDGIVKTEATPVIRDHDGEVCDNYDDYFDETNLNLIMADPDHTQYTV